MRGQHPERNYIQTSDISQTLGNTIVDHSDVVGASSVAESVKVIPMYFIPRRPKFSAPHKLCLLKEADPDIRS